MGGCLFSFSKAADELPSKWSGWGTSPAWPKHLLVYAREKGRCGGLLLKAPDFYVVVVWLLLLEELTYL